MRHRLLNFAALLSALCLTATTLAWPISHYRLAAFSTNSSTTKYEFAITNGRLVVGYLNWTPASPKSPFPYELMLRGVDFFTWSYLQPTPQYLPPTALGISWVRNTTPSTTPWAIVTIPFCYVAIPLSYLTLLFAILPALALLSHRRRQASRAGLCPKCSYDLRAHAPGSSCPECGTLIIKPR